jgi:diguanylate cyclase (GGDEF)-like protein
VRSKWRFSTGILLPIGGGALAAVALATIALFWAVYQSNSISVERQIRTTRHTINSRIDELVKQQQIVAVWDPAVLEFNKTAPDWQWIDDNMGVWLNQMFGHDRVYIVNARDEPVYAMIDGKRASASEFHATQPDLQPLIDGARKRRLSHEHDGLGAASGKVEFDAHFLNVLGQPAEASVMKIVPLTSAVVQQPGSEFVIISVRFLDGAFLKELSERNLINGPRFSRTAEAAPDESVLPLRDDDGKLITYFMWRPELPGTRILRVLGPVTALVLVAMVVMTIMLLRRLQRSMSDLETTVVELQASEAHARASEAHAQHLASHDVLTGLPNRTLFDDRLDQALARTRRGEKLAILTLDLDRFKHVNDTFGHLAGDNLIREFSGRLSGLLRATDTVARLSGDEFAIVQVGIENKDDVEALCARILEAVRQPFDLLGNQAFVGVSIGVVLAPEAGFDRVDLMRKADIALYSAKAEGRDGYRYFVTSMDETVKQRACIEEELRTALAAGDELKVFFQPQLAAAGQHIIGLEALVRWQHPTRGLILPDQFIPVAEETGLIVQLGELVLRQACVTSRRWPELFVAVNLSAVQFRSSGFAERVIKIVRESGADPRKIELEVTESVLLDDGSLARDALQTLRGAGFKIALDDFGTGYSSLSYLRHFEVDKIKIDQSFVQHLGHAADADSAAIVTAIITLGHSMGLTVTAEGVETEDQRRFLSATGCNEMQGYLFSRALPEDQLADLLSTSDRA